MSSDFGVRSAGDVIAELTQRLSEAEDRAERAERERDAALARLEKWRTAERTEFAGFTVFQHLSGTWARVPEGEEL